MMALPQQQEDHIADSPGGQHAQMLMYSALAGHASIVQQLLAAAADVSTTDKHGNTPLVSAAAHTCTSAVAWPPPPPR